MNLFKTEIEHSSVSFKPFTALKISFVVPFLNLGNDKIVEMLIQNGANVNSMNRERATPIFEAVGG